MVTRAEAQAGTLVRRLRQMGAETVEIPAIAITEPSDGGAALRVAARRLPTYEWVVFTSVNAVDRFLSLLDRPAALGAARVAAIGPGTAAALGRWGVEAALVPERFVAESLLAAFPRPAASGRVLLPRAAVARDVLPQGLRAAGWHVDVVEAYRTARPQPPPRTVAAAARADAITFTSPSTVSGYLEVAGPGAVPPVVACIGPVTATTARELGLRVDVEAGVHTIDGLVDALAGVLARPDS